HRVAHALGVRGIAEDRPPTAERGPALTGDAVDLVPVHEVVHAENSDHAGRRLDGVDPKRARTGVPRQDREPAREQDEPRGRCWNGELGEDGADPWHRREYQDARNASEGE